MSRTPKDPTNAGSSPPTDKPQGGPENEHASRSNEEAATASAAGANAKPDLDARTRVLTATVALLGEVGWGQITTRKVAKRADVNNALIHYYFGTKAKLLSEAATHVILQQFGEPLALLAEPDIPVGDAVAAAIRWLGSTNLDPVEMRALSEVTFNGLRDPALADLSRMMLAEGRAALTDRLEGDGFDPARAEGVANAVFALLDGLLLHRVIDPALSFEAIPEALAPLFRKEPT